MAKQGSGGTPATAALQRAGVLFQLHPYDHDPRSASYGLEAAAALGVEPARVFKTLLAAIDPAIDPAAGTAGHGRLVVGIVPVAGQLDLKALARAVGASKAVLADIAVTERATGYVVGGISPVGQKRTHRTVLDDSAWDHPTIYVSAGRRGLDLEITPADLAAVTNAAAARIRRE